MEVEQPLFISGEDILKRWKGAPFQLVGAMLDGDLVAINPRDGKRYFPEQSIDKSAYNCFFCQKPMEFNTVCYSFKHPEKTITLYCDDIKKGFTDRDRTESRISIALKSCFYLREVEAYEQAHGLGPLPHKPETAEALAETLRAAGITDAGMIARMVKAAFPDTRQVDIGLLLADGDDKKKKTLGASIKRAQRAKENKDTPAPAKRSRTAKAK